MDIFAILKDGYMSKGGIYMPSEVAKTTVWDTLASDDLLDAATSATSEEHATQKGAYQIEELAEDAKSGIILDLGCGYARIAEQLLPKRQFSAYVGVDSSLKMLRYARKRKEGRTDIATPLHFVYGAIDAIPLKDASVDTVVVSAVFLHNHKSVTRRAVDEVHRVLKPGGTVFVYASFPNLMSLMGFQGALYLFFMGLVSDANRNGPVRFFGRGEVRRMFGGFSDVSVRPFGFALLPKRILILPRALDRIYREYIANPGNKLLEHLLGTVGKELFPTHHDVVAIK